MKKIFRDRKHAGRLLAAYLQKSIALDRKDSLILALPRGGVPVGIEVANALHIPIDILVVKKIGHSYQPEYSIGAVTEEGYFWVDPAAISVTDLQPYQIQQTVENATLEVLERIKKYRGDRALTSFIGKTILLIDDGLATGVTSRVAAQYVRSKGALKIILAVPIAPDSTAHSHPPELDEIIFFQQSPSLLEVGQFYQQFSAVRDQDIVSMLAKTQTAQRENLFN